MRTGALVSAPLTALLLTAGLARATVKVGDFTIVNETCHPLMTGEYDGIDNGVVDPDEVIVASASFTNASLTPTVYATIKLYSNANVIPLVPPEPLGVMAAGAVVTRTFAFAARGTCGQAFDLSFGVFDGDASVGSKTFTMRMGVPTTSTRTIGDGTGIVFPSSGAATPYPATITVSGMTGDVEVVTVHVMNLSHTNPDDIDMVLVVPDGRKFILMSDVGGSADASDVTLHFSAGAAASLPDDGPLTSGFYQPTNIGAVDAFEAPAPAGPYSTDLSSLAGMDPNGAWQLFVMDDAAGGTGSIGFWSISIQNTTYDCCSSRTKPVLIAEGSEVLSGNCLPDNGSVDPHETVSVRFAFRNYGNGDAAGVKSELLSGPRVQPLSGVVTSGPLPVGAAGTAIHSAIIRAPAGDLVPLRLRLTDGETDLGTLTYSVRTGVPTHAGLGRLDFSDPDPITVTALGSATPYPAGIFVVGVEGTVEHLSVTLNGVTHPNPDDLDILLVGPTGRKVLLMSDAGGAHDLNGVNLTFDDAAAAGLPDEAAITAGTYRPTNFGVAADPFAAPAPAAPYAASLSEFAGVWPAGTWKLYVTDDALNNAGSIAGWTLTFQSAEKTYTYTGGPDALYDRNTVERPIAVDDYGYVGDLFVSLRTDHPNTSDLDMYLVGPDGTEVPLVKDRGGAGNNFGTGSNDCAGTPTEFTDHATRAISAGAAPFTGSYRPESPLGAFDGKPMRGEWKLRVFDDTETNLGTLGCWKIRPSRAPSIEFVKNEAIVIPSVGFATPFPSVISVTGVTGRVVGVSVRLTDLSHTNPDDLDIFLLGPSGQVSMLMSDAGGTADLSNVNLTFTGSADAPAPDEGPLATGYYRAADYCGADDYQEPEHFCTRDIPTNLAAFRGAAPNGNWQLFISDDTAGNGGSLAGWSLTLHVLEYTQCTGTAYTAPDVQWAAGIAAGLVEGNASSIARLDVVAGASAGRIDGADVVRLQRKVRGTEPNP